jgi:hypothetical protein
MEVKYILRVVWAVIGVIAGLSAGVCFTIPLKNPDAGASGFASGDVKFLFSF